MAVAIDPVCGMEVEIETAKLAASTTGPPTTSVARAASFDFDEDPETYLAPDYKPEGM